MCDHCNSMAADKPAGNFFERIAASPKKMEEELLGPPYSYFKNIKTPSEMGMSGKGSLSALAKDISGLVSYTELLVTGGGDASATGRPLGNQFFLKTGGTCKDVDTGRQADRFMYINNIPDGSVPFISSGMGVQFTTFEGIIPGILGDLNQLNPLGILKGFMEGTNPECQNVTLPVTGQSGATTNEMRHVPVSEIESLQPCLFPGKKNPITGDPCREAFSRKANKHTALYVALILALIAMAATRYLRK